MAKCLVECVHNKPIAQQSGTFFTEEDGDVPQEYLIPKYELTDLCSETAKLKSLGAMAIVPPERLVRLLNILEKNIRDGAKVTPIVDEVRACVSHKGLRGEDYSMQRQEMVIAFLRASQCTSHCPQFLHNQLPIIVYSVVKSVLVYDQEDDEDDKLWMELVMERILRGMDASLTAMYIMTASNMSKRVYLEDVIERCVQFTKFQLSNTIYPSFDPVYRVDSKKGTG